MKRFPGFVLLLLLAISASGCMLDARGETAEGAFTRELTVTGPVTLEIETGSGEVIIRTADAGAVKIEGRVRSGWQFWDDDDARDRVESVQTNPPIEQSGNDIHIGRWPRVNNVRISYMVTVPKETSIRARTGSGDVGIGDLQGPVTADTGSGEIRIGRIGSSVRARTGSGDVELAQGVGEINIRTGSGDVLVRSAGDGRSEVSTGSGDVEVEAAAGSLRVRTGSGRIRVAGAPKDNWDLGAGSGDLSLEVPSTAAFNVDLRSSSGDIDAQTVVSNERSDERSRRRELRGAVGAGGPLVSMSTGSGEIRIR